MVYPEWAESSSNFIRDEAGIERVAAILAGSHVRAQRRLGPKQQWNSEQRAARMSCEIDNRKEDTL